MREKLQEAVLAAKGGDEEKARLLLAQYLREEPDYVPGWVLLSKLATSEVQKVAFLRKVLSLDPDHKYALEEMAQVTGATPPEISQQMAVEAGQAAPEAAAGAGEQRPDEPRTPQAPPMDVVEESTTPEARGVTVADAPDVDAPEAEAEEAESDLLPWEEEASWDEAPMPWEEELQDEAPIAEAPIAEAPVAEAPAAEASPLEEETFVASETGEEDLDWFLPDADDETEEAPQAEATAEAVTPVEEDEFDFSVFDMEEGEGEPIAQEGVDEELFDYEGESFEAQSREETMPAWMSEGELEEEAAPAVREEDAGNGELFDEDSLPDWLQQEEPDAEWLGEAEVLRRNSEESEAETEARLKAAMAEGRKQRAQQPVEPAATSRWVVIALVLLALLVFLAAMYMAATYLL
jgi:hypothetical protein